MTYPFTVAPPNTAASRQARTLLIVDDDADMRLYLRKCLQRLGDAVEQILEAEDGAQALDILLHQRIDLVIADVVMPHMDGYQLCRQVKQHAALYRTPVVLVSGLAAADGGGLTGGADAVLYKPFNWHRLKHILLALLGLSGTPNLAPA